MKALALVVAVTIVGLVAVLLDLWLGWGDK